MRGHCPECVFSWCLLLVVFKPTNHFPRWVVDRTGVEIPPKSIRPAEAAPSDPPQGSRTPDTKIAAKRLMRYLGSGFPRPTPDFAGAKTGWHV